MLLETWRGGQFCPWSVREWQFWSISLMLSHWCEDGLQHRYVPAVLFVCETTLKLFLVIGQSSLCCTYRRVHSADVTCLEIKSLDCWIGNYLLEETNTWPKSMYILFFLSLLPCLSGTHFITATWIGNGLSESWDTNSFDVLVDDSHCLRIAVIWLAMLLNEQFCTGILRCYLEDCGCRILS